MRAGLPEKYRNADPRYQAVGSDWCREGDATLQKRLDLFLRQRERVLEQIEKLNQSLDRIDYKIWHYRTSVEAGTERCGVGKDQDSYEKWKAEKENQ